MNGQNSPVAGTVCALNQQSGASHKVELAVQFLKQDDSFWGIEYNEVAGCSEFTGLGFSSTQCTGYAIRIQEKLGVDRVKIVGFNCKENPTAGIVSIADGHDFAIIDDRYIIDPWLIEVESGVLFTKAGTSLDLNGQGVFDTESIDDSRLISLIYGKRSCWNELSFGHTK